MRLCSQMEVRMGGMVGTVEWKFEAALATDDMCGATLDSSADRICLADPVEDAGLAQVAAAAGEESPSRAASTNMRWEWAVGRIPATS